MAIFPKIQSPCPYRGKLSEIMDGDVCRLCRRQVFDLTHMTDSERVAFMRGCEEEVCVSYSFRPAAALAAAAALGALAAPVTAAAQDECEEVYELVITGGGIKDLANVEYFDDAADAAVPELPVVYETADETTPTPGVSAPAVSS